MPRLIVPVPPPDRIEVSPAHIKELWDEAERESREDAPELRARARRRASRHEEQDAA